MVDLINIDYVFTNTHQFATGDPLEQCEALIMDKLDLLDLFWTDKSPR